MKKTSDVANLLGDTRCKRDHIVASCLLDLENPLDIDFGLGSNLRCRVSWHDPLAAQNLEYRELDLQPVFETAFVTPKRAHRRARVSRNHFVCPLSLISAGR